MDVNNWECRVSIDLQRSPAQKDRAEMENFWGNKSRGSLKSLDCRPYRLPCIVATPTNLGKA